MQIDHFEPDEDDLLPGEDFDAWTKRKDLEDREAGLIPDEDSAERLQERYDPHMGSL